MPMESLAELCKVSIFYRVALSGILAFEHFAEECPATVFIRQDSLDYIIAFS